MCRGASSPDPGYGRSFVRFGSAGRPPDASGCGPSVMTTGVFYSAWNCSSAAIEAFNLTGNPPWNDLAGLLPGSCWIRDSREVRWTTLG